MSFSEAKNPYRPGVGLRPTFLAGRDSRIAEFKRVLRQAPEIPGNVRLTGLRGVGKTVLLGKLQEVSEEQGWMTISVELEPRHCADETFSALIESKADDLISRASLVGKIKGKVHEAVNNLRSMATVTFEGFEWSLAGDLDKATRDVAQKLDEACRAATQVGKHGVVIYFDEAQVLTDEKSPVGNHPLSTLVAAISTLQKQQVPVCLVLCGLPTLAVNLLSARTYSERMFRGFEIGALDDEDARAAFTIPLEENIIGATPELVDRVVKAVAGYPYFIQLWGAELWEHAFESDLSEIGTEVLDVIEPRILERLDLDFYEPRIQSLTPAEQDLLISSANCEYPPIVVEQLNDMSVKAPGNVNVLLGRLVKANILYRPRKGQYLYTAPQFREFLQRRKAEVLP